MALAALRAKSRDHARTPVQWDASDNAGFTTGKPWIGVNPNYPTVNAESERADPDSVFHHYRRLIELRHADPVVAHGDFTMLLPDDPSVYAFTRRLGAVELLVVCNMTSTPVQVDLPEADDWAGAEMVLRTPSESSCQRPPGHTWSRGRRACSVATCDLPIGSRARRRALA